MQAGFENFSIAATDLLRKIEATSAGVMVMPSKVAGHVVKGCWLCGGGELVRLSAPSHTVSLFVCATRTHYCQPCE
jgi:hypothetical protein